MGCYHEGKLRQNDNCPVFDYCNDRSKFLVYVSQKGNANSVKRKKEQVAILENVIHSPSPGWSSKILPLVTQRVKVFLPHFEFKLRYFR